MSHLVQIRVWCGRGQPL